MDDMVNKNHLEWNVYKEDFNRKRIVKSNVFNYVGFLEGCKKAYRKYKQDDQVKDLEKEIRSLAMYYFWAKCEYEIILTGWPPPKSGFEEMKIDIYDQLTMNWDYFFKYITDHKKEFLKREPKKK